MIRLVLGLGFGDEGKGTIVDWLARQGSPPMIVRWNGGPQAAHHVVTDDGRLHCFAQLGSGSFVDGVRTHLGPQMAVDPYALHVEAAALAGVGVPAALSRLSIDPRAVVVTPWHAIVNQVRELLRGGGRHGSTGRGVFEAKLGRTRIVAGDLADREFPAMALRLRSELAAEVGGLLATHRGTPDAARELAARATDRDLLEGFLDAVRELPSVGVTITPSPAWSDNLIFEGAQGALLDRDHGFFPYVTPSWVTRDAAELAAREMGLGGTLETWGVLRAFHTRHGAGPFPSEDAGLGAVLPEPHNPSGVAGAFRIGRFDAVLARWALQFAGPIDKLVVTCLDRVEAVRELACAWTAGGERVTDLTPLDASSRTRLALTATPVLRSIAPGDAYLASIEEVVGRRVDLTSWGMTARDKRAS